MCELVTWLSLTWLTGRRAFPPILHPPDPDLAGHPDPRSRHDGAGRRAHGRPRPHRATRPRRFPLHVQVMAPHHRRPRTAAGGPPPALAWWHLPQLPGPMVHAVPLPPHDGRRNLWPAGLHGARRARPHAPHPRPRSLQWPPPAPPLRGQPCHTAVGAPATCPGPAPTPTSRHDLLSARAPRV